MVKIYETVNEVRLTITIDNSGTPQDIVFEGGRLYPQRKNGTFRTDNPQLQKSLESDSSFGIDFRLKEKIEITSANRELLTVEEVTNRQSAIEWMRRVLGVKFNITTKSETIVARAAESGYLFINWNLK